MAVGALVQSVSERAGFDCGPEALRPAMNLIRARTIKMLEQLPVAEWESSSRCAGWSVHDVARHIRDFALIHTARLAGRPSPFGDDPFDPRSSPAQWLRHSEGTPTTQTLDDLRRLAGEEAESIDRRIDDPPVRLWWSPLRRKVHWSVFSLHIFWDAWLHESDIAVALGRPVDRSTTPNSIYRRRSSTRCCPRRRRTRGPAATSKPLSPSRAARRRAIESRMWGTTSPSLPGPDSRPPCWRTRPT
ncbi:maleylpyruvate isomerase N-terminal domain-containing protein [Actinoplanes sp. NPDC089786]|uniref:maleylpyruvate isomerase N-terminal domain-containing protein n=1 Tax=Actinoplanes sp. NPDC089786 TaxID=3155185 RepID=UPI00342CD70D